MSEITNTRQRLLEPLPNEALKQHPTRSYLTTINAIYVTERFNDVFGLDGWSFRTEIVKDDGKWVVVQVFFTAKTTMVVDEIESYDTVIERSAFGGNDNEDLGDRYKGAVTDALTKIGSMLGVGAHVWKNQSVPARASRASETPAPRQEPSEQVAQRSGTAVPQGEPTEWLNVKDKQGRYTVLGLEYAERVFANEMTVKDIRKLFKVSRQAEQDLLAWKPENTTKPSPLAEEVDDDLPF